jgi:hypothetical protein
LRIAEALSKEREQAFEVECSEATDQATRTTLPNTFAGTGEGIWIAEEPVKT